MGLVLQELGIDPFLSYIYTMVQIRESSSVLKSIRKAWLMVFFTLKLPAVQILP
jgi:hypothetical protein